MVGACSLHYASGDRRHLRSGVEDRSEAVLRLALADWRDCHVQDDLAVDDRKMNCGQGVGSGESEREDAEVQGLCTDPHD